MTGPALQPNDQPTEPLVCGIINLKHIKFFQICVLAILFYCKQIIAINTHSVQFNWSNLKTFAVHI